MPMSSARFVTTRPYHAQEGLAVALGGLRAALVAALIVKSLPLGAARRLVVVVDTAVNMLLTADQPEPAPSAKANSRDPRKAAANA